MKFSVLSTNFSFKTHHNASYSDALVLLINLLQDAVALICNKCSPDHYFLDAYIRSSLMAASDVLWLLSCGKVQISLKKQIKNDNIEQV